MDSRAKKEEEKYQELLDSLVIQANANKILGRVRLFTEEPSEDEESKVITSVKAFLLLTRLSKKLEDDEFVIQALSSNSNLSKLLADDSEFAPELKKQYILSKLVASIDKTLEIAARHFKPSNPIIGIQSKNRADTFAQNIGKNLEKVRKEGNTTMRSIADRFNELGIKSARGHDWSHSTVYQLIKRRRKLGLENDETDTGLDMD